MDETLLRELYATVPTDFVATRNRVVKTLRKEKRRDEATALAGLRRPGWPDWALNAIAAVETTAVRGFAAAASDVRDAQAAAIEGRDGPDVRSALRTLRERTAELVHLAEDALIGAGRQPVTGDVNARLTQVATNDVAVDQLVAGILGSGDTAPADLFSGLAPTGRTPDVTRPVASSGGDAARRAATAERALDAAEREHRGALEAHQLAEDEVGKAEVVVDEARVALAASLDVLGTTRTALEAAASAVVATAADVEVARTALDA